MKSYIYFGTPAGKKIHAPKERRYRCIVGDVENVKLGRSWTSTIIKQVSYVLPVNPGVHIPGIRSVLECHCKLLFNLEFVRLNLIFIQQVNKSYLYWGNVGTKPCTLYLMKSPFRKDSSGKLEIAYFLLNLS